MASLHKKKHYQVTLIREEVKRYVDIIKRVVDVFIAPWKEKKRDNNPMLTPKAAECIFGNFQVIMKLEKTFLEDLDKLLSSETIDRVGAIIGQKSGYFKLYSSYATNLRNAIAVLFTQLEQNTKFAAFVANGEKKLLKEHKHNMAPLAHPPSATRPLDLTSILQGRFATSYLYHDLPSLLVVPLQFLPRFHRLLANLGAMLPPQDVDSPVITELEQQSQIRLDTLAQDVENVRRVSEMQASLTFPPNVVSSIDPMAYVDHRRIVKEGILKEVKQGDVRLVYLIVFSDIILFTTKKEREEGEGHRFLVHRIELLGNIRAEDQELGHDHNGFQIRVSDTVTMLQASNTTAKDEWLRSLRTTIQLAQASRPKDSSCSAEEEIINDFGGILKALATNQLSRLDLPEDCLQTNDSISFLSCLSSNKSLTFLSLAGSQLGDSGMSTVAGWLQKTTTLRTFSLSRNRLSHLGVSLLSDALRSNDSITSLDLSSNQIGTLGLGALVTGLIWNNSIQTLSLADTNLSPMCAPHLVLLFETNKRLQFIENIRENRLLTDGTLSTAAWAINNSSGSIANISTDNKGFLEMIQHTLSYNRSLAEREGKSPTKWNEEFYLPKTDVLDMKQYGFVEINPHLVSKINTKQRETRSLDTVVSLQLDNNSLISLNPEALVPLADSLRELSLHHNQLASFPDLATITPNLTHLDISENSLLEFPKALAHLKALSYLNLGCNLISDLPSECIAALRGMKALRQLLLHKNHLMQVPRALFTLHQLTLFSVAGNPSIPVIKQKIYEAWASRVTMLDFSNLGLSFLPRDIEYLTSLVELILRDNHLKELPPQIGRLPSLEVLDISRNQISVLPRQLAEAPKLKIVRLAGTPAAGMTGDLLTGSELQRRLAQSQSISARCPRLKLLLVGKANVGKTSVFKSLKSVKKPAAGIGGLLLKREGHTISPASMLFGALLPPPSQAHTQLSTDGIDMEEWTPAAEGANAPVSFNVFDFAGQDVYYATHQFFISPRSVFLVVFDMKKVGDGNDEYASILYWLQCIEARGAACPVVLVGTHLDEVSSDHAQAIAAQVRQIYFGKFPNVKEFVAVNAKTSKNVSNLLRLIVSLAQQDPSQQELVPASFLQLESLIVAERKQHTAVVTLGELNEWGRCCGVKGGEETAAVRWLHDLGTIVHWGIGGHDDLVILDPNWLVRLLCTLVTTKANFVSNGILLRKNLDMIWKAPDFPSHLHEVLLSVLQKFELLYLLPDRVSFLIPNLLNNDRPKELEIPHVYKLERVYQFTFMPFGLFARLMIRIIHFMDPKLYWRNGILATANSTSAFLEFQPSNLQLEVQVWGSKPAKYLRFVMESIEVLARGWYAGVGCKLFVSCACHACSPTPSTTSAPNSRAPMGLPFEDFDDASLPAMAFGTLRALIKRQAQAIVAPRALMLYSDFEDAMLAGKLHLTCPNGGRIEIPYAAPELTLTDISNLRIGYGELDLIEQIGRGGFGTVWRATIRGQQVAVKKLGLSQEDPSVPEANRDDQINMLREFRREVWLSSTLTHRCIVSLTGFCISPNCIILEYMPHGNLHNHMKKVGEAGMSWEFRIKVALNIAEAIGFLHSQNPKILHRDLKSPNVLLLSLDARQEVVCKVSDFGESRVIATSGSGRDNLANPVWLAPEVLRRSGGEYTEKADIFSFGIILWELVTCQKPYQEYPVAKSTWVSKFEDAIVEGLRPTIPADCPKEIRDLIERCWSGDPTKRPIISEVHASLLDFQTNLPQTLSQKREIPTKEAASTTSSKLLISIQSSPHPPKPLPAVPTLIIPQSPNPVARNPSPASTSPHPSSPSQFLPSKSPLPIPRPTPVQQPPLPSKRPQEPTREPASQDTPTQTPKAQEPLQKVEPAPIVVPQLSEQAQSQVQPQTEPLSPKPHHPEHAPKAQTPQPQEQTDKVERMRAIISRVLERAIEYLSTIQSSIESAESVSELTQLGNSAKQLYMGAKKLDTFSVPPNAPKSPRAGAEFIRTAKTPPPMKTPMDTSVVVSPPTRFNSTVINNTTINNTNINITINSPNPEHITEAINNAINEAMNNANNTNSPDVKGTFSPEQEKLDALRRRLVTVNRDACDIMKSVLQLAMDETTDHQTVLELAKLVMTLKQSVVNST